jgi:putative DNA primase/helicase
MPITRELARSALQFIPADLPRDEWVRIGMALKAEFPDEEGLALFDEWSATGAAYKPQDVRATWRSIKAGGPVGIGTLIYEAQSRGFVHTSAQPVVNGQAAAHDARAKAERSERSAKSEQARVVGHLAAAEKADARWNISTEGPHPYLERKGVKAYGVRIDPSGHLVIPLRDETGKLYNIQCIAAAPKPGRPEKLFLPGGRKSGLWHQIGSLAGASAILVAEGYATAASVHEATGRPTAVAFDAGNMIHVARALKAAHPDALIVLCADDDKGTKGNPGIEKATAAAKAARGVVAVPDPLPPGATDFNDLHTHAGLARIREIIDSAIASHVPASPAEPIEPMLSGGFDKYGFALDDAGVWHAKANSEGERKDKRWVCSWLVVDAQTRDQDGGGWGYLLQFKDPLDQPKQWAMPARLLSGDGGEYRSQLLSMGLKIAGTPDARTLLALYIQTRRPPEVALCTDRIGWHGHAFVLPRESLGDDAERIVFQSESQMENTFKSKGTTEQWRERVCKPCRGNSRLVFAISCAFAGPLLRPAGVESGGFHFRGDSSSGKTTALKLAASVNGGPNYLQRWRTTDNALEAIAAQHCDSLLILDELAQVDPKTVGECAYMLANEQSKARSTRTGMPRARLAWRLLFLSAGELGLSDHMSEGGKRARTGQEIRMADIPADAGVGLGMFEQLHGHDGGSAFARYLTQGATACYGAPGRAFLQWLCDRADTLAKRVRTATEALALRIVPSGASGQVERVGARFALVGVAGELATEAGLTGWAVGEAERGAKACFDAWMAARGGAGNGEVTAMLRAVRKFIETHGAGRFPWWHRNADDHAPNTQNRAGVRRLLNSYGEPIKTNNQHGVEFGERMPSALGEETSTEYFVTAEVFRTEVCMGFDHKAVAKVLADHGCLVREADRYTCKPRIPGMGHTTCYRITSQLLELEL